MVTREITDLDQLTIVKLLAAGRDPDFVGAAVKMSRDIVIDIASRHGHPDRQKLAWAADIMQANLDKKRTSELPAATGHRSAHRSNGSTLAAVPSPQRPAQPQPAPSPIRQPTETGTAAGSSSPTTPVVVGTHLELVDLLERASKSAKAATRAKGERLAKLISELRQAIRDEAEDQAFERTGRGRSPAQLQALGDRSDHQDEVLTRHDATRADVIAWAQAHGWPDVSPRGRFIKTEIIDAYDAYRQGR